MSKRNRVLLQGTIILLWLVMLALLIHRHYWSPRPQAVEFTSVKEPIDISDEWMGIYFKGEKIGYALTTLKRRQEGYESYEHALMHLTILGTKQRIESRLKAFTDNDFKLRSFDFQLLSGPARFKLHGTVTGNTLALTTHSGKNKARSFLRISSPPYVPTGIAPYVRKIGLQSGKEFSLPLFDPATLSNSEIKVSVVGKETIIHSEKLTEVYRLRQVFQGIETTAWVSTTGEVLREETALGLTLLREPQEIALAGDWRKGSSYDLAAVTAITPDKPIREAGNTSLLRMRIPNLSLKDFEVEGGRQTLNGDVLEVRKEQPGIWRSFVLPYQGKDCQPFLRASPLVESNDPRIIKTAASIAKGERDAEQVARTLLSWVYENLEKKPVASIPSAVEVLAMKAGDCNEHTALYTALARALGIPTRICAGIVYLQEKFYYHSWPEVFLGTWVAVDPTFNQFPTDATHVRLVVGELRNQVHLLQIIGRLQVEILEYS